MYKICFFITELCYVFIGKLNVDLAPIMLVSHEISSLDGVPRCLSFYLDISAGELSFLGGFSLEAQLSF